MCFSSPAIFRLAGPSRNLQIHGFLGIFPSRLQIREGLGFFKPFLFPSNRNLQFPDFTPQCDAVDAEVLGGPGLVVAALFQRFLDLFFGESSAGFLDSSVGARCGPEVQGEVGGL